MPRAAIVGPRACRRRRRLSRASTSGAAEISRLCGSGCGNPRGSPSSRTASPCVQSSPRRARKDSCDGLDNGLLHARRGARDASHARRLRLPPAAARLWLCCWHTSVKGVGAGVMLDHRRVCAGGASSAALPARTRSPIRFQTVTGLGSGSTNRLPQSGTRLGEERLQRPKRRRRRWQTVATGRAVWKCEAVRSGTRPFLPWYPRSGARRAAGTSACSSAGAAAAAAPRPPHVALGFGKRGAGR